MASRMIRARASLPFLTVLLLGGCASPGNYPSLARRPAERVAGTPLPPCAIPPGAEPGRITGSAEPVAPAPAPSPPPASPDRDLDSRLAGLMSRANIAHSRFLARQGQAERTIAAAARSAVGSEAWSVAEIALAELDSARSDVAIALAEIDSLHVADSVANPAQPGPDSARIAAAREQMLALVAQEDAVLQRLGSRLPG